MTISFFVRADGRMLLEGLGIVSVSSSLKRDRFKAKQILRSCFRTKFSPAVHVWVFLAEGSFRRAKKKEKKV